MIGGKRRGRDWNRRRCLGGPSRVRASEAGSEYLTAGSTTLSLTPSWLPWLMRSLTSSPFTSLSRFFDISRSRLNRFLSSCSVKALHE